MIFVFGFFKYNFIGRNFHKTLHFRKTFRKQMLVLVSGLVKARTPLDSLNERGCEGLQGSDVKLTQLGE